MCVKARRHIKAGKQMKALNVYKKMVIVVTYFSISFRISSILIPSLLFMLRMPTDGGR